VVCRLVRNLVLLRIGEDMFVVLAMRAKATLNRGLFTVRVVCNKALICSYEVNGMRIKQSKLKSRIPGGKRRERGTVAEVAEERVTTDDRRCAKGKCSCK
jgi:hypothetical protein